MAVMASPQPEAAATPLKPADPVLDKENATETNGHTSPSPVTNGKSEPSPGSEAVAGHETQNAEAVTTNQAVSAKSDAPDTAESTLVETQPAKEVEPTPDVEMGNSATDAPSEKPKSPEAATSPSKPSESSEPTKDTAKDVEMEDAAAAAPTKPNDTESEPAKKLPSPSATPVEEDQPTSLSQLALNPKDDASTDINMEDVPAASIKVAREREEDASVDEPAAKRARTEPSEDETSLPAPTEPSTMAVDDGINSSKTQSQVIHEAFRSVALWTDPLMDRQQMNNFRIREYRRILAGAKKTKAGGNFRDSVPKMWPGLAESYIARIDKPMDIGLLERNLRDGRVYKTLGDFKKDLALLYYNAYLFNGALHEVTLWGKTAVEQIWAKLLEVPLDEPSRPKATAKHNPSRHPEPRPAVQAPPPPPPKKESRPAPVSPAVRNEPDAYAVPPGGVPQARRASTQNETDRPKRTIHPPKNRDIDYTAMQNFNKKKLPLDLQFGYEVVNELMDPKHELTNGAFLAPVDPIALQIPNYFSIIKKPMDLSTMKSKFVSGEYTSLQQVQQDVKLIIANCNKFNGPDHPVTFQANALGDLAKSHWVKKDQWLAKNTPAKVVDEDTSDEEEEEDEEREPVASKGGANSSTIAALEKRLADESAKLVEFCVNVESTDETMIDIQRTVVNTIRKRLIEEKEKAASQKVEKTKGKPGKPSGKSKTGPPSKKSGAFASKKSAGSANKKKRLMSQAEKDAIANGINDLDESNITKAIDIIKKDTGQSENDSGELELEIDQLTNDALHKLWDLLKRVLPGFAASIPAPAAPPPARSQSPVNNGGKASKSGKPKKNKPMNAKEQEARIAELERLKQSYVSGQEPDREPEMPLHPLREDSSDSEEE
ncbi:bromodomain-containing factor 1 [Plectosphaerella plurivora]|uniref:Bromodomain-containing factor 1 n=1 Tax=Plectosphaerella plurivora TaxID=936078 RepID=A0A9P9A9F4_9PEZI|nr:bromodomain-containing factor 1 [Plectosphaerella plurivora]